MDLAMDSSSAPEPLNSESPASLEVTFSMMDARAPSPCPTCQVTCICYPTICPLA